MFAKELDILWVLRYNFSMMISGKGSSFVNIKKENRNQPSAPRKWDPELLLAVFLLIFIVLAIAMTALLVVSYVASPPADSEETEDVGGEEGDSPVFSGALYPALPQLSGESVKVNSINSEYAALVEAKSGKILAHKGGDQRFHPASMTKIMTLIVACEQFTEADLEREVFLTEDLLDFATSGVYAGASRHGFEVDEKVRIKDLLYGIGVVSGADCTLMTVQAVFDTVSPKRAEAKFVDLMNQKAEEMGLKDTHFENSVGVEGDEHYTTAAEMAAILAYALESPLIEDILSTSKAYTFYIKYTDDGESKSYRSTYYSTLFNTNADRSSRFKAYKTKFKEDFALSSLDFCGGKTGTLGSGTSSDPYLYSLASFAKDNGEIYILITGETTLGYGMLEDAKNLYDTYAK